MVELSGFHFIGLGIIFFFMITVYGSKLEVHHLGIFNITLQVATLTIFIIQLMLTLDNYHQQAKDRTQAFYQRYASLAQMKLNDIDKLFWSNPNLDRLYFEMYQGEPHIEKIKEFAKLSPALDSKNSKDILKSEHHACQIIFQTMADIYLTGLSDRDHHVNREDLVEWIVIFRKWMRSKLLRCHWKSLHTEHHPRFQEFMMNILSK